MKPFRHLCMLPLLLCMLGPAHAASTVMDAAAQLVVIERTIEQMNARYVFPDVARKLEPTLRKWWSEKGVEGKVDPKSFADQLTAQLQAVTRDKHLRVFSGATERPAVDDRTAAEAELRRRAEMARQNYGIQRVEQLPGNIGLIDLRRFAAVAQAADSLAAAMTLVAHSDALIIDLRRNVGGDSAAVASC